MKLKQKLLFLIITPILISFIILTFLAYSFSNKMLLGNAEKIMLNSAEKNAISISKIIKEDIIKMEYISSQVSKLDLDDKEKMNNIITDFTTSIDRFETLFIGFPDKTFIYPYDSVPDDYDCTTRGWYKDTMAAGKILLSEPYIRTDGVTVITITAPVIQDGKSLAVLGVDVSLDEIKSFTKAVKLFDSGTGLVLHNKGFFLAHPTYSANENIFEADDGKHKAFGETLFSSKDEFFTYGDYLYTKSNIEDTDWTFVVKVPTREVKKQSNELLIIMCIINVILLIIIIIIVFIVATNVSRPINLVTKALDKLANYNLNLDEEKSKAGKYIKSKDEIGAMIRSIDSMVTNLKLVVSNINSHATSTAATSEQLTGTAKSTSAAAAEVSSAVGNIAQGATSQAHDTTEAAQNIEENSKSLSEMISILEELKEATKNIDNKKDEGKNALDGLRKLSEENREESEFINQIILETNDSAENISKASEMIQSIADQTNLLALNAAIEAARAGEAGKGFAVVADEIRKLAEDSTKFTGEIRTIIDDLKEKAQTAVDRMEAASKIVEEQDKQTKITKDKFDEIENAVITSEKIVARVNENSKLMEEKNSEIISIIENLSAIAEENAATTEEASASVDTQTQSINDISSASSNLAGIASELQNEVAQFKF